MIDKYEYRSGRVAAGLRPDPPQGRCKSPRSGVAVCSSGGFSKHALSTWRRRVIGAGGVRRQDETVVQVQEFSAPNRRWQEN